VQRATGNEPKLALDVGDRSPGPRRL